MPMNAERTLVLLRWSMLGCVLLFLAMVAVEVVTHPQVLATAGATGTAYAVLLVTACAIYTWFAWSQTRPVTSSRLISVRHGTTWGLLCGLAWAMEFWVANHPSFYLGQLARFLYRSTALCGSLLPVVPALLTGWQTRRVGPSLLAGLFCGMIGGLTIFLAALAFTFFFPRALYEDPQMIAEFERSGLPDMETYVVGDMMAALIAHLWIGLMTGSVLGLIGGVAETLIAPRTLLGPVQEGPAPN
jgi:hypothetical protein